MPSDAAGTETGRVRLREVTAEDLPILFEHQRDPVAVAMAAFPGREWEAFQAHWTRILADATTINRTILYDGQVVGSLGSWEQDGERDLGYWLDRAYWGRGIATQALTLFLRQIPTRPLYARVAQHNIGSRRVLEKCGFTVCGEGEWEIIPGSPPIKEWILILAAPESQPDAKG